MPESYNYNIKILNERILNIEKALSLIHPQINYLIFVKNKKHKNTKISENSIHRIINTLEEKLGFLKAEIIGLKNCKTEYASIW